MCNNDHDNFPELLREPLQLAAQLLTRYASGLDGDARTRARVRDCIELRRTLVLRQSFPLDHDSQDAIDRLHNHRLADAEVARLDLLTSMLPHLEGAALARALGAVAVDGRPLDYLRPEHVPVLHRILDDRVVEVLRGVAGRLDAVAVQYMAPERFREAMLAADDAGELTEELLDRADRHRLWPRAVPAAPPADPAV